SSKPNTVRDVIDNIRDHLDFRSIAAVLAREERERTAAAAKEKGKGRARELMSEAIIIDSLKTGIRFDKVVMEEWLKIIGELRNPRDCKVLDILVLLIVFSISPATKKKIEVLFRKKVEQGVFTKELLEETIGNHAEGLTGYSEELHKLASMLLRGGVGTQGRVAGAIYCTGFKVFDTFHRQETIASLVTHIGSGLQGEVDAALQVLLDIVQVDPKGVERFGIFIKSILDYLENLTVDQIRVLFDILCAIAIQSDAVTDFADLSPSDFTTESPLLSDIHIVIRKQLESSQERFKRIGIVGAIAIVRKLAAGDGGTNIDEIPDDWVPSPKQEQALNWIDRVFDNCKRAMSCLALAFDELSYVFSGGVDPGLAQCLTQRLGENIIFDIWEMRGPEEDSTSAPDETQATPQVDDDEDPEDKDTDALLKTEEWFALQFGSELSCPPQPAPSRLRLRLYPIAAQAHRSAKATADAALLGVKGEAHLVVVIPALLKLIVTLQSASHCEPEDIESVMQAGLIMWEKQDTSYTRTMVEPIQREAMCTALFWGINCLRELLNTFNPDVTLNAKNAVRIIHILYLEENLNELMDSVPRWSPPGVFIIEDSSVGVAVPVSPVKAPTARRTGHSKFVAYNPSGDDGGKNGKGKGKRGRKGAVIAETGFGSVDDLRPHMRELE
ncbi:Fanconi anaemia protein FancD2 nuclease-domain-containing protein, partial [Blyttiomyces helicus]